MSPPPENAGASKASTSANCTPTIETLNGVPEGRRDDAVFKYASRLRGKDLDYEEARRLVLEAAANCTPPFPEPQALKKLAQAWKYTPNNGAEPSSSKSTTSTHDAETGTDDPDETFTASQLLNMNLPEPTPVVEGLIPEGLSLLCGPPKKGKSWLALLIALAVALGLTVFGSLNATRGEVLYLALEDGPRRLKSRLLALLGKDGAAPEGLYFRTRWPRLDEGGAELLGEWLATHPAAKLVVIDTLARVRKKAARAGTQYGDDYDALIPLMKLGNKFGVAILVIHHTRKAASDEPLDTVSGTRGLTGCMDTGLILTPGKRTGMATLTVVGRDIGEVVYRIYFDPVRRRWEATDRAIDSPDETSTVSPERQRIIDLLEASGNAMGPKEIATALGENVNTVKWRVVEMARRGQIVSNGGGGYIAASSLLVPGRPSTSN